MISRQRRLDSVQGAIETRARAMGRQIQALLARYRATLLRRLDRSGPVALIAKVEPITEDALLKELFDLLVKFGGVQAQSAAGRTTKIIEGSLRLGGAGRLVPLKEFKGIERIADEHAKEILRATQRGVSEKIERILNEARAAAIEPNNRELAVQIKRELEGAYEMSWERSSMIARTELSIAENVGHAAQYEELEIEEVQWVAFKAPIWPRRHDLMDGKTIKLGQRFELPSGVKLRFPGDPEGPAGEIIRCRCTTIPVIGAALPQLQARALEGR
jgi:hypothetical protein